MLTANLVLWTLATELFVTARKEGRGHSAQIVRRQRRHPSTPIDTLFKGVIGSVSCNLPSLHSTTGLNPPSLTPSGESMLFLWVM
jgi:hypothetical protein